MDPVRSQDPKLCTGPFGPLESYIIKLYTQVIIYTTIYQYNSLHVLRVAAYLSYIYYRYVYRYVYLHVYLHLNIYLHRLRSQIETSVGSDNIP